MLFLPLLSFLFVFLVYKDRIVISDFNTLKKRDNWIAVYATTITGITLQGLANFLTMWLTHIKPPDISFAYTIIAAPVIAVIFIPVVEEVVFRRIVFGWIRDKTNWWIAAVISSLLFAVSHNNLAGFLGYFIIGYIWCWVYKNSNNLMITIVSHAAVNFVFFLVTTIKNT